MRWAKPTDSRNNDLLDLTFAALEKSPPTLLRCGDPPYELGGRRHALDNMSVCHGN